MALCSLTRSSDSIWTTSIGMTDRSSAWRRSTTASTCRAWTQPLAASQLTHVYRDTLQSSPCRSREWYVNLSILFKSKNWVYFFKLFKDALQTIYNSILSQSLAQGFSQALQKYSMTLVNGALALHQRVTQAFLPTAIKFHYVFNLRDLSNIFQVILLKN